MDLEKHVKYRQTHEIYFLFKEKCKIFNIISVLSKYTNFQYWFQIYSELSMQWIN